MLVVLASLRSVRRLTVAWKTSDLFLLVWVSFLYIDWDAFLSELTQDALSRVLYNDDISLIYRPSVLVLGCVNTILYWQELSSWLPCIVLLYAKNASNNHIILGTSMRLTRDLEIDRAIRVLFHICVPKWTYSVPRHYLMRSFCLCWNFRPVFGFPKQLGPGPQSAV